MDGVTFNRLADRTRLGAVARQMARRILVDGLSAAAAGRECGKSRALASRAEWRIRALAADEGCCPTCGRPL